MGFAQVDLAQLDSVGSATTPRETFDNESYFWVINEGVTTSPKSRRISLYQLDLIIDAFNEDNAGRTITRSNFNALNGTTFTTLEDVFFPPEPPTASLLVDIFGSNNGSNRTVEVTTAGTTNGTANWTAGRSASTGDITSITAAGVSQTFSNPPAPGTVNGSQAFTVTNNTNTTISLSVVSTTGNATDNVSISWLFKRYWGTDANGTLTDAELIAGSNELSGSRAKTFSVTPANEFVYFAYPQSYGNLTSITVNGFESISAFTLTTQSHTNASGGITTYNVYVSNNLFTAASTIVTQ